MRVTEAPYRENVTKSKDSARNPLVLGQIMSTQLDFCYILEILCALMHKDCYKLGVALQPPARVPDLQRPKKNFKDVTKFKRLYGNVTEFRVTKYA